jgi:hypothetical protein
MAQQGKQMRVGARKCFAYYSLKLVLLATGNRYEVDSKTFFLSGKALYPFWILPCPNSDLFRHTFISVVCGVNWWSCHYQPNVQITYHLHVHSQWLKFSWWAAEQLKSVRPVVSSTCGNNYMLWLSGKGLWPPWGVVFSPPYHSKLLSLSSSLK